VSRFAIAMRVSRTSKRVARGRGLQSPRSVQEFAAPRKLAAISLLGGKDEYVLFSFSITPTEVPVELSSAEQDVVQRILEGCSNAEIAKLRRSSTNTVANQLRSIYSKLGVSGRLELVQHCVAGRRRAARKLGPSQA
jgi:DNA-binding NarL/FixJ family response regulator